MNWTLLFLTISMFVTLITCHQGYYGGQYHAMKDHSEKDHSEKDQEEEKHEDHIGPNPYLSDKWFRVDRSNSLTSFMYLIFKYGQATCVEPVYDLALRFCKTEMVSTPFEKYIGICTACLLIRDLDQCLPPCSPNNFTCMFYPMNVDVTGAYNFLNNAQQGASGFDIDQRG